MILSSSSTLTAMAQKIKARNQSRKEEDNLSERPDVGIMNSFSPKKMTKPANNVKPDKMYDAKPVRSITRNPTLFS